MLNRWRTINSWLHKIRLHSRRGKGTAGSFSRYKLRLAPQKEGGEILCDLPGRFLLCDPGSCNHKLNLTSRINGITQCCRTTPIYHLENAYIFAGPRYPWPPRKWAPLYCCLLKRCAKLSIKVSTAKVPGFLKCGGIRGAPLNHGLGHPRVPTSATEMFSSRERFNAILQQIALP